MSAEEGAAVPLTYTYDPAVDSAYINTRPGALHRRSQSFANGDGSGVVVDLDEHGNVVGVELVRMQGLLEVIAEAIEAARTEAPVSEAPHCSGCGEQFALHHKYNGGNPVHLWLPECDCETMMALRWATCLACGAVGEVPVDAPADTCPVGTRHGTLPELPCCDYRDHSAGECLCPEHQRSALHPLGYEEEP